MSNVVTPFKVGILTLVGIAAGIFMLATFTSDGLNAAENKQVYAMFDDVTGLAVKSRVRLAGIAVGEIESIRLEGRRARVTLLVRKDIELKEGIAVQAQGDKGPSLYYKNGATVSKKQASLIGDSFLEITPGEQGAIIQEGEQIHNVRGGLPIDQIFEKLNGITTDIQNVTSALSSVLGGDQGARNIEQIIKDLQNILATVNRFVVDNTQTLGLVLDDAKAISSNVRGLSRTGSNSITEILDDSKVVVRDAKAIVQEVRYVVGQSSDDVQAGIGSMSGTLIRLQSTLDSLNYSLQNIQDITDKVNEGEGTLGALVNDPSIAENADGLLVDARSVTAPLARLRTIVGLRSEYHFVSGEFKNFLSLKLQPSRDKYYLLEVIDDFRGVPSVTRETVTNPETGNEEIRETRTVTDDLKFSFLFAYTAQVTSWLAMTGRFGLMESTGGVGANLLLFEDRSLNVQADLFDFQFNDSPRVRIFATYGVMPYLNITAGFDDILNSNNPESALDGRNFYMGLGFSLTDDDLKALLTATGVPSP